MFQLPTYIYTHLFFSSLSKNLRKWIP